MSLFSDIALRRSRGKVIQRLAERLGLVYFGAVNLHRDDHTFTRDSAIAATHAIRHFAAGTYDGYDVSIVDRFDKSRSDYRNWTIVQVSLHQQGVLPHLFFLPHQRGDHFSSLFAGTRHLAPLDSTFSQEFSTRYQLLADAQHAHTLPNSLLQSLTSGVSTYFWPHALEIRDDKLYVYLTEHRLDEAVLESAVKSALWLADLIEASELSPYEP